MSRCGAHGGGFESGGRCADDCPGRAPFFSVVRDHTSHGTTLAEAEKSAPARTFVIFAHAYNQYWGPNRCGYGSLLCAGLYTEEEARKQQAARPQVDRAVSLTEAIKNIGEDLNPEIVSAIAASLGARR